MPGRKTERKLDRHLGLRIDGQLLEAIQAAATAEGRSLNSQVLRCIERYLLAEGWGAHSETIAKFEAAVKARSERVRAAAPPELRKAIDRGQ